MCDKLKGVPIGPLHPDGEGLLVNETGTFMIDESAHITPGMLDKIMSATKVLKNMEGVKVVTCSTPMGVNPFYDAIGKTAIGIDQAKSKDYGKLIIGVARGQGKRSLSVHYYRIRLRQAYHVRQFVLWSTDLMYLGIRTMLWGHP